MLPTLYFLTCFIHVPTKRPRHASDKEARKAGGIPLSIGTIGYFLRKKLFSETTEMAELLRLFHGMP